MAVHRYPSTTIVKDWAVGATTTREDCNRCGAIIWRRTATRNHGADPEVTVWTNPRHPDADACLKNDAVTAKR